MTTISCVLLVGVVPFASGQPSGTFRVDTAAANKHANETSAAAAWNGDPAQLHVVCAWNDYRTSVNLGVAVTVDGFVTTTQYARTAVNPNNIKPALVLPSGNPSLFEYDPMTAVDPLNGDLYVGGIWETAAGSASESGIFVARKPASQMQAPHFTQIVNVIRDPSNPSVDYPVNTADKPWMTVGRRYNDLNATRVYVAFNHSTDNSLFDPGPNITWSDDQGQTWSTPSKITLPSNISVPGAVTGPLPRVGPDGKLYVSMYDKEDGRILLQRSTDGGTTWLPASGSGSVKTIATLMDFWVPSLQTAGNTRLPGSPQRLGPWPCIAVDPSAANKLYCVFIDTTRVLQTSPPTPGLEEYDLDIYFTKSTDYGDTWTTPVKKFTSGGGDLSDQFFPWIEVDETGRIHLSAYDTRRVDSDPVQFDADPEGYYNNYYRYSSNAGGTWTEVRLTSPSWVIPCNLVDYFCFNDYAGMAIADTTALPVFTTINRTWFQDCPDPPDPNNPNCCEYMGDGDIKARIVSH